MKYAKDLLLEYLKNSGIEPHEVEVGFTFRFENWNFLFWSEPEDPMFFRLTLPGVFDVTEENYAEAILATNETNLNFKVVKAIIYDISDEKESISSVWICYEQFLDPALKLGDFVPRAIHIMIDACDGFLKYMNEDEDDG
jgi:hypothetical protein